MCYTHVYLDITIIVSQWCDHANLETTLIYAYADAEHKRQATARALGDSAVPGKVVLRGAMLLGTVGNVLVLANDCDNRLYFVCVNSVQFIG